VPPSTTYLNDVDVAANYVIGAPYFFSRRFLLPLALICSLHHLFQYVLFQVRIFSQVTGTQQTLKSTSMVLGMVVFWGVKLLWAKLNWEGTVNLTWDIALRTKGGVGLGGAVPSRTTGVFFFYYLRGPQ
jgi:hypothetical protein